MFGITTELKKCIGLKNAKFLSVTGNEKCWFGLNTFFIQICMLLSVCHFAGPVPRGTNIKCMKSNLGNAVPANCYICYLLLNLWKHSASMSLKLFYYS